MTVISLASRTPRCLNCRFWTHQRGPAGECSLLEYPETLDPQTDQDWWCPEFRAKDKQ